MVECAGLGVGDGAPELAGCPSWEDGGWVGPDSDDCDIIAESEAIWGFTYGVYLDGVVPIPSEPIEAIQCISDYIDYGLQPQRSFCCGITGVGEPTCWGAVGLPSLTFDDWGSAHGGMEPGACFGGYLTLMNNLPEEFAHVPPWLSARDSCESIFSWTVDEGGD